MFSNRFVSLHNKSRLVIAGYSNLKSSECSAIYLSVLCGKPTFGIHHPAGFARCINTNTVIPPQITKAFESASSPFENLSDVESLVSSIGPIPEPPALPLPPVPEILSNGEPSIASLGLDSWWPNGLFQKALEYIHVTLDVPWWGSIIIVTAMVRIVLFPVVVRQLKANMKFSNNMPQFAVLQAKFTEARAQNDHMNAARYGLELQDFMKEKEMSPFTVMKYSWVQGFVILSFTSGLRGMCALPVESMRTGGCLHITDLTAMDSTYILPVANAVMLFLNLKLGVDVPKTMSHSPRLALAIQYGLPAGVLTAACFMYNSIGLYWLSTAVIALIQNRIMKLPGVREYLGIPAEANREAMKQLQELQKKSKKKLGFFADMKQGMQNSRISNEIKNRAEIDELAFERAGREPLRKTYKFNPKEVAVKKKL